MHPTKGCKEFKHSDVLNVCAREDVTLSKLKLCFKRSSEEKLWCKTKDCIILTSSTAKCSLKDMVSNNRDSNLYEFLFGKCLYKHGANQQIPQYVMLHREGYSLVF